MGKSKGGGGGGAGKIEIPQALGSSNGSLYYNAFNPLGTFGSQQLSSLDSLYNWATDLATGGNVLGVGGGLQNTGMLAGGNNQTYAPFTGQNGLSAQGNSLLGPILGGEYSALAGEGQTAGNLSQMQGAGNPLITQGQLETGIGNRLVNRATTGTGLFPSQQAMINQSVASQQAATQQQLGNMGLGSSTVGKQLAGQISLSGAAAAGQLVQGNLQLGEEEQQLGSQTEQSGIGINTQINEALYNEYAGIANQSQSMQAQLYQEALSGMGALGNMMNSTLASFGYSMQTQQSVLQANEAEAGLQTQANLGANQASAQGFSSMLGGLGSLFGSSGSGGILGLGGTGGLFGSSGLLSSVGSGIGSIFGGGSAAAGAAGGLGAAGASAGAAAGGGSALTGIISALGAVFACQIAQVVYGIDDLRWIEFREYLLFRAPRSLRKAYVNNASWISREIRGRSRVRALFKFFMNLIISYDKATREV